MAQFKIGDKVRISQENYVEYDGTKDHNVVEVPFNTTDIWEVVEIVNDENVRIKNLTNPNFPAPCFGQGIRLFRTELLEKA